VSRPVEGMPELIYSHKPAHARPDRPPVLVRRLAYPRGVVPPQLQPYVEAVKRVKQRKEV